jgi:hypothetical protein
MVRHETLCQCGAHQIVWQGLCFYCLDASRWESRKTLPPRKWLRLLNERTVT